MDNFRTEKPNSAETQEIECDAAINMDDRKWRKTDRKPSDQQEAGSHLMLFIHF